jgi:hypothetical protein
LVLHQEIDEDGSGRAAGANGHRGFEQDIQRDMRIVRLDEMRALNGQGRKIDRIDLRLAEQDEQVTDVGGILQE